MAATPHRELIPVDKGLSTAAIAQLRERGAQHVYRGDARDAIAMPCGGICAGQMYVRGDGRLDCFQVDGRHYGTSHEFTQGQTPRVPIAQGFRLTVEGDDGNTQCVTLDDDGYDAIEFIGEYPRALVRYRSKQGSVPPVEVDLEVFSPFVPLDARRSGYPATVLNFTLRNTSDQRQRATLTGWLENFVFGDRVGPVGVRRRNRALQGDGVASVLMDAVAGDATEVGEGTLETPPEQAAAPPSTLPQRRAIGGFRSECLVNTYTNADEPTGRVVSESFTIDLPYLGFLVSGGRHPEQSCVNLVIDAVVVRTAFGRHDDVARPHVWNVSEFAGRRAYVEIIDRARGTQGEVRVDHVVLSDALPDDYAEHDTASLTHGSAALSIVGNGTLHEAWRDAAGLGAVRLVGAASQSFEIEAGASVTATFLVTWHFPNLHTGHGRMYANWFDDARDVAVRLAAELDELTQLTRLFCDTYYRATTLPWWLATRLMMPTSTLASGTAQWWRNGRFWGWEGVGCCHGTCTHVWNYAHGHARLFPELARSARSMQDLGAGFHGETAGRYGAGLVGFRGDHNFAADGQAGTVLKSYREHLTSRDNAFLEAHWPRIKLTLDLLTYHDALDGAADGMIRGVQHNTFDINFVGANTFVGSLYLAALRAGEAMALRMHEPQTAARYRRRFEAGRRWSSAHLFNGEYFEQRLPEGDVSEWQYGRGCLSDQVFGCNWADQLGLGALYEPEQARSALAAVFKYNFASDVADYNAMYPPERYYAWPGDAGVFICTWPRGGRPTVSVRYRDEVWTGIEYQVAAGLAQVGLVDEALQVVHAIDRRYDGRRLNPWNEIECGHHYARGLASWGVLHALAGYTYDGPAGRLSLAPRLTPEDFACFFVAAEGWGALRQTRGDHEQTIRVEQRYGTLQLREIGVHLPGDRRPAAEVVLETSDTAAKSLPATVVDSDSVCTIQLHTSARLSVGDSLVIRCRW